MNRRAFLLSALGALPSRGSRPEWPQLAPEVLAHFKALLKLDTSNPPGNETLAASYLKRVLDEAGVPCRLHALDSRRANLVARLEGAGRGKPVLLMGHTDVVGVERERWRHDPFGAIESGGYIYGRGAVDDKDAVVAGLMTMLLLKRSGVSLDRDVIFLAEAGEEGATRFGIDYMVAEHWPEIEAEFAFAEGGWALEQGGKVRYLTVTTTEKLPRGLTLRARGEAGHGSVPTADNAVVRLAKAVARIAEFRTPPRLNETTREYFRRLAAVSPPGLAARYEQLLRPGRLRAAAQWLEHQEPANAAVLRTTIVPTMLRGGFRSNVIPSEAEALLDIRALPDENISALYERLRAWVDDAAIEFIPRGHGRPAARASRIDTAAFAALERVQKRMYPDAITLPAMLTGATDLAQLRAKGVQCYGIGPYSTDKDFGPTGAHSDNERISPPALLSFCAYVYNVTLELAAAR